MFVIAYALCVKNCVISIFSPASRQSIMMLNLIRKLLGEVFGMNKFEKDNQENLFIRMDIDDLREINAYPSSVETLR